MNENVLVGLAVAAGLLVIYALFAVRVVNEYERGVIFRLGRVIGAKGPGLFFLIPLVDKMVKANLQTFASEIPPQELITKDNVTIRVTAVTYFSVVDAVKSVVSVANYRFAVSQVSQTTLRTVLGQVDLDALLVQRDDINQELQRIIDGLTEPWGIKVSLVELKDVELPESMRRAMARQAEAERERRAKVIHAQGELEASTGLRQAAEQLETPAAMQLRVLSTLVEVSNEKSSVIIFPIPIELLPLARRLTGDGGAEDPPAP
ncbi:MAG: SPFH domain-containing protein [Acidimicrobiales bacterium]